MKFPLDQDVYAVTARFLTESEHDVVLASEIGMAEAGDEALLKKAPGQQRIFITRDRDFGHLVFVRDLGAGVLYLRILPPNINGVHVELERVLKTYSEDELRKAFVVVEFSVHRFRKPLSRQFNPTSG